ncbi:MAG TPA: hypothetical protein VLT36_07480, partial [Candidatus Dormibacteraeota bacterium]|nr:hypothetical protein [Candidatus Dormibacteraeota bacterium]
LLIRQNQEFLDADPKDAEVFPANWQTEHQRIEALFEKHNYSLNLDPLLQTCAEGDRLRHEMAVEAGLLFQLSNRQPATASVFGTYDYLHHQVVASPFKPVDYIDKMDVFGYSYVPGFEPTKSRFLVGEVKKDEGLLQDLEQLMKYVDWVKEEYASGDYSMIRAFLVAYDFEAEAIERLHEVASRRYVIGRRPAVSREWKDLKLVRYRYDSSAKRLVFSVIS